jgi:hypothetical protein
MEESIIAPKPIRLSLSGLQKNRNPFFRQSEHSADRQSADEELR